MCDVYVCMPRKDFSDILFCSSQIKSKGITRYMFISLFILLFICFSLSLFGGKYGSSQARGLIGAVAADLHHRHSNARSEPHL